MKIGFTGTRQGMSTQQSVHVAATLRRAVLVRGNVELHEGDCEGSDAEAAELGAQAGCRVVAHPPDDDRYRAFAPAHEVREPAPYLERDMNIAQECDRLIATPATFYEIQRSGTWITIRYARERGKPVTIIYPDGRVEDEK